MPSLDRCQDNLLHSLRKLPFPLQISRLIVNVAGDATPAGLMVQHKADIKILVAQIAGDRAPRLTQIVWSCVSQRAFRIFGCLFRQAQIVTGTPVSPRDSGFSDRCGSIAAFFYPAGTGRKEPLAVPRK